MLRLRYQAIQLRCLRVLFLLELCALNCGLRTKNNPSLPTPSFISPPSLSRAPHPLSMEENHQLQPFLTQSASSVLTLTQKQVSALQPFFWIKYRLVGWVWCVFVWCCVVATWNCCTLQFPSIGCATCTSSKTKHFK